MAKTPLRREIKSTGSDLLKRRVCLTLFFFALTLRFVLLALPSFSTDTQRFLADGLNVAQGRNPYTAPPPVEIEYSHLRSFYPPLQQAFFGAAVKIYASPWIFRLLGGLAELLFLIWFFRRKFLQGRKASRTTRWIWLFLLFNPVSLHEIWREGHLDHIGAFMLYFAIVNGRAAFARRQSRVRRYFFAFAGIGWKFTGILAPAFFLKRSVNRGWQSLTRRAFSFFAIACGLFFALQLLPAVVMTPFAERGFIVYAQYWHHGNGVVHLLENLGFAAAHGVWLVQRGILLVFILSATLYVLRRLQFYEMLYLSLGTLVVLFPVQHPWYYFLLFPVVLLSRQWRLLMALVCLTAPLSYLGYIAPVKSVGFIVVCLLWFGGCIFHFTRHSQYRLR